MCLSMHAIFTMLMTFVLTLQIIYYCRYMFDQSEREAEELKSLSKSDVINWYKTYLQPSSPKSRRLAIRIWGCNSDIKEAERHTESAQVITDLAAFKMSSKFYPSLC